MATAVITPAASCGRSKCQGGDNWRQRRQLGSVSLLPDASHAAATFTLTPIMLNTCGHTQILKVSRAALLVHEVSGHIRSLD